jgi:hypothetical protein
VKLITPFLSLFLSALLISGPLAAQTGSDLQIKVLDDKSVTSLAVQILDANGAPVSDAAVLFRMPESGATATFADGSHAAVTYSDQSGRAAVTDMHWTSDPGPSTVRITATRGTSHAGILLEHAATVSAAAPIPVHEQPKPAPVPVTLPVNPAPPAQTVQTQPTPVQPGTLESKTLPVPQPGADSSMPKVSVTSTPAQDKIHSGGISKKWLILAIVAGGAGAGIAMMGKGKSSSSTTTSTTGISIGAPTVSVGHP